MPIAKKLPSGNYRALIYIGKDEHGKRQYKSFTSPDKWEAENMANQYRKNCKDKPISETSVLEAINQYIDAKRNVLSPTTVREYESTRDNRLGALAAVPIADVDAKLLQKHVNTLANRLAPKTIANTVGIIVPAIQMVDPNKHFKIDLPQKKKTFKELLTPQEVICAVKGKPVELPALLAMWLSLRLSEVRGLQYGDIKEEVLTVQRTVHTIDGADIVREQTKTYDSTRRIRVPSYLLALIGNGQEKEFIVKLSGTAIYKQFKRALAKAELQHMRFHDLRHLNASIGLSLGIHDKLLMERGGWSTTSTLKNVYQHTFSADRQEADRRIDEYFNGLIVSDTTQNAT